MNDYERAAERFETISRSCKAIIDTAQAVIDWANDEYEAAQANLRQYESQPGIALPQYRRSYADALAAQKADALKTLGMDTGEQVQA